jgi:hypothetical protein
MRNRVQWIALAALVLSGWALGGCNQQPKHVAWYGSKDDDYYKRHYFANGRSAQLYETGFNDTQTHPYNYLATSKDPYKDLQDYRDYDRAANDPHSQDWDQQGWMEREHGYWASRGRKSADGGTRPADAAPRTEADQDRR